MKAGPARWLAESGWFPERDIGEQADELIRWRLRDAERQGCPLTVFPKAGDLIRCYGLLRIPHPKSGERALVMDPRAGYEGDAADIAELAANLGQRLFPVGYETPDLSLLLVDEEERFFYLHHTGAYYCGSGAHEMFTGFINNVDTPDAEDFFVR
ncbi:hypothetical protein GCM10010389_18320 [Streptomyces echinoruber]|uniref:SUKH-3 domain containing protein n=1 Tax=Streptomyces echinoruber TaxID=68898 RepID=A0A918V8S1_9ACTN|nr:hypothetical protein GCM10010389_18320 [Streptomyces echinoruber]